MSNRIQLTNYNVEKQYFTRIAAHICQFLTTLSEPEIIHFSHWRIFSDKSVALITTHPGYSVLFVKNKFYEKAFAGKPNEYQSGLVFYEDLMSENTESVVFNIKKSCIEYADYKPDLIVTEASNNHVDMYCFGTRTCFSPVYSFYVNRLDKLYQFIRDFRVACKYYLSRLYDNPFIYPTETGETTYLSSPEWSYMYKSNQCINKSNQLFALTRQYRLTPKEIIVASYLISGCTPKEVAAVLDLSTRTVEKHIASLKVKTRSRSTINLVSTLVRGAIVQP